MGCDICEKCEFVQVIKGEHIPEKTHSLLPITNLFFGLTENCNFRCRYCFVHQHPKDMTYDIAKQGIDWMMRQSNKKCNVYYFGGEPTLKWHDIIVPLTTYAKETYGDRITFGITTNGYLLNEDELKFMQRYDISMHFSFDGCKNCMDYNRPTKDGASSFDVLVDKIPMFLKYHPNVTMRATLDNDTVKYFYESHKFAIEQGFKNTFFAINTFADWTQEQFKILEQQLYKVADLFIQEIKRGKVYYFNPLLKQFSNIIANKNNETRDKRRNLMGYGKCGIGANGSAVLSTEGNIYTCQEVYTNYEQRDHFYIGNIFDGINDDLRKNIFAQFKPYKSRRSDGKSCDTCNLKNICGGGCLIRNYTHYEDMNIVPASMCEHDSMTYDVAMYIMNELKDNKLFNDTFMRGR